MVNNNKVKV